MSTQLHGALASNAAETEPKATRAWIETAVAVLFAVAAVVCVSLLGAITGLA